MSKSFTQREVARQALSVFNFFAKNSGADLNTRHSTRFSAAAPVGAEGYEYYTRPYSAGIYFGSKELFEHVVANLPEINIPGKEVKITDADVNERGPRAGEARERSWFIGTGDLRSSGVETDDEYMRGVEMGFLLYEEFYKKLQPVIDTFPETGHVALGF